MSLNGPAHGADKKLLGVLQGERPAVPPVWLMRQAGRYLPEYRELRADKGGFLELVYDSAAAAEVTLQPLRRFGFDGAILFSDILIVPYAMGQDLWFEAGEGPRLAPILAETDLSALTPEWSRFDAVYDTVRRVKAALNPNVTFLGFAGSPWTIATYMVAGQGSKDHGAARRMAYGEPDRFAALIDAIIAATVEYLSGQIAAGVEAVQLFDSWSGSLAPIQFERWVIDPNRRIVAALKERHPDIPVIGFPKGGGREAGRLCGANRRRCCRRGRNDRSALGAWRLTGRHASAGQSRSPRPDRGRPRCGGGGGRDPRRLCRSPAYLQPWPWDFARHAHCACRGAS